MSLWALIVHGGAKEIPPEDARRHSDGCLAALEAGCAILRNGGTSLDAVERSIMTLEDDPTFNAGYGSVLNSDGRVEMDAGIMEGEALRVGAIAGIQGVRNPIRVARAVLPERPVLLAADGARRFAVSHGIPTCAPEDLVAKPEQGPTKQAGGDTVGCVALDLTGGIVAAASTGGLDGQEPGRIGDSPIAGAGFYADNKFGGVTFSGDGEYIARVSLSTWVMRILERGSPQLAVESALNHLGRVGGEAGGIVLNGRGELGWAHNSSHFAVAYCSSVAIRPRVFLRKEEERHE